MPLDNVSYTIERLKAIPAYELFCELSAVLGQSCLALALQDGISVHLLVAQSGASPTKTKDVLCKLFAGTFKNILVDGVLHHQQDLDLGTWCKLIDIAMEHQFKDFFLGLRGAFLQVQSQAT